jgi:hypothetical protein
LGWLQNPCCDGNQADRHHGGRSAQLCARRLSPFPPTSHVAPARSPGGAGRAPASGSGDASAHRFERCRAYRLPAANLEVASPSSCPVDWRRSPLGDRGAVPSARCVPLRRCLVGQIPALWRSETRTGSGASCGGERPSRRAIAAGGMARRPASSPRYPVARAGPCRAHGHDSRRVDRKRRATYREARSCRAGRRRRPGVLDLYKQIPPTRITDLLLEVDAATGFSEASPICAQERPAPTGSD